jgi:uncharacterized protein (DUF3820 family)
MPIDPFSPERLLKVVRSKMPFGKYSGRIIADLPEPYLVWFSQKGFPEGELGELMALAFEIKANGLEDLLVPLRSTP